MKPTRGFTLIEVLIYLALFAILMGGAVVAAYNLFEAATHGGTRTMLQEESDFLLAKVEWALGGAQAVTAPGTGTTGSTLSVVKWDTSVGNPIVFSLNNGNLLMSRGSNAPTILNNTNVVVSKITFTHNAGSGDGINPESVVTAITLTTHTSNGFTLSRAATTTVYIRH
jgi:prepilin-type N-terminal cleavage/methylation domain-containing protein